ncbi:MAG: sodium:calcium antiporter [Desulfocapsaceae bacterium]|nr:sodium:calcium antiporter [Desulfocapsaceae bacterium]
MSRKILPQKHHASAPSTSRLQALKRRFTLYARSETNLTCTGGNSLIEPSAAGLSTDLDKFSKGSTIRRNCQEVLSVLEKLPRRCFIPKRSAEPPKASHPNGNLIMLDWMLILAALAVILLGATVFTNGLEWFGKRMNLSDGAVGSIFAAVGTALPETLIPIISFLFGSETAGHQIGVGAIIGAPFMLGTLAMFITGLAVMLNRRKRDDYPIMRVDTQVMERDMRYFLILYSVAIGAAFLPAYPVIKIFIALLLCLLYGNYMLQTLRSKNSLEVTESDLDPCYFAFHSKDPALSIISIQVISSLFLIVLGSYMFVQEVQTLSARMGVSPFIMAMIIAPIATELPEKFNSVIWIRKGKDTLAIGNITGAMVFQGSVITAIGILMTPWHLDTAALSTVALTFASVGLAYCQIRLRKHLTPGTLLAGGSFYFVFIVLILTGRL